MTARELIETLLPAYSPCEGFSTSCSSLCTWAPQQGIVPCGFGGAKGDLSEVGLIIVTAEPGDPSDDGAYFGEPIDMVHRSIEIFERSMKTGNLGRSGRPTAFHKRMRLILDLFWPGLDLETQMRRTWTTNAVLCPAAVSSGKHAPQVEKACASRFLLPQLDLLPNAFVFVLGAKAARRMQDCGARMDATGPHPSSRMSYVEQEQRWRDAAEAFQDRGNRRKTYPGSSAHPRSSETGIPSAPRSIRSSIPATEDKETSMPNDLDAAIKELPAPVAELFSRLRNHPDFDCRALTMQMTVHFQGEKVGGLNRRLSQWYVSKLFVRNHGGSAALEARGFRRILKGATHEYWAMSGAGSLSAFREAISEMTGTEI